MTKKQSIIRRGPLEYSKIKCLKYFSVVFFIVLYAPIINLIIFSFNDSRLNIVWRGFTIKYYVKALQNETLILSFINSLSIAFISTMISTLIGLSAAICLWKFNFRLKTYYDLSLLVPIIIPEICMGVAMLIFFNSVHWPVFTIWPLNLSEIIIAHISFSFPFVVIIIRARLGNLNKSLIEASKDLGATEWITFRYVIFPFIKPALIASSLLTFILSLDDFIITFFTSGPNNITLPVKIYSMVRFGVSPEINAASTILIMIVIISTVLIIKFLNYEKDLK